ncbi:MAG: tetratricopeptide repeat protein [Candidatus Latescibacteria bacterium]|nr:tetratricopeptide repeat protein [Candidatus Latescibacterota bacterium]
MPKPHRKPPASARPAAQPKALGLSLFRQGDYAGAIAQWSKLEGDPQICPALAEAHFRLALASRHHPAEAEAELRRAVDGCPQEARYWYHLGLALHRADQLEEARAAYAFAAELGYQDQGLGLVRGLAEVEVSPSLSLATLPWLSAEDQAALTPVAALLRGEPQTVLAAAPGSWWEQLKALGRADLSAALWQGLAWLEKGEPVQALEQLTLNKGQQLRAGAEQVRVFYRGLAMATAGDPQAALAEWTEVARSSAKAKIPLLPRLHQGLAQLRAQHLAQLQDAGQWAELLRQAQEGLGLAPGASHLLQFQLAASQHLATAAAGAGEWVKALAHWQRMRSVLEQHADLGPLPPVLRNLAIAHEALEQWEPAAQAWTALLRTLPRRTAKKREPGDQMEEERAWLRRRSLDNHHRAGRPDQAIAAYKQAVKAAPEDLELRLELASALLANDQTIAARNELHRILEKDEHHTGAHQLLAEVHQTRQEWEEAERSLRRAVAIDPADEKIRRGLVQLMGKRGVAEFNTGRYRQAQQTYTEALAFSPADLHLLALLADTELVLGNARAAQECLEAALATGKPEAYGKVFECWIKHRRQAEARQLVARAEKEGAADARFYLTAGTACLTYAPLPTSFSLGPRFKKKTPTPQEKWGREMLQKSLALSPDRGEGLHRLLDAIGPLQPELALEYAGQLCELEPKEPRTLMNLGLLQAMAQDLEAARETLGRAERLAREQGQKELVREIAQLRHKVNDPFFGLLGPLLARLGPEDLDEEDFFR